MDPRQLDMLHDGGNEGVGTVGDGVGLHLDGVFQKLVDENGPLRGYPHGRRHIAFQHLLVVDHLHPPSPEDVGGTDHEGVADPRRHGEGLGEVAGHARLRHGNPQFFHHDAEPVPVLRQVDGLRGGADDPDPGPGQLLGDVQGRLAAELDDHPFGLLLFVDGQDVLHGQGFEVELVGGVVVRGDRFGVAVDHDGFITLVPEGEGGMDAAVVEFDPLADAVGTAA